MEPDEWSGGQGDPEAPYGRRSDGKPYTVPLEERQARAARMTAGRKAKAAGGKSAGAGMSPPPLNVSNVVPGPVSKSIAERRAGLIGFAQLPIGLLATVGKVWEPAMLDAMTLTVVAPELAHGAAVLADSNETVAKWIDKLTASSPYLPLAIAGMGLLAQVAVNHGLMPPNRQLGSMSVDDMKDRFYATIGAERPASDPRRDAPVAVPDYPPQDMSSVSAAA